MSAPARPVLAVDMPYLLYRAFFSIPKSVENNALLGAATTLLAVSESVSARAVVVCLGAETATYRGRAYPPYHAHRPPMPPELEKQFELVPELFEGFGWLVKDTDELEADDLVHSYAQVEAEAKGRAFILTGDRDLYQSINQRVHVLMFERGAPAPVPIDADEVMKRYGVRPERVPDFIALRGDPSDGIPGAKGIGEKSARELLETHDSLDDVIARAPLATKPSAAVRALPAQADLLRVFRDVATVRRIDVKRPADTPLDKRSAGAACRKLGLKRLATRFD